MKIDCSKANNKFTRKDLSLLQTTDPLTFFVNDGTHVVTDDTNTLNKQYIEIADNCICKDHPTGFISD